MKAWINIFLFVISVHLAWDASTSVEVTGYRLYYGNASRSYGTVIDVGNVTDYVIGSVHEEQPIFFAVKAYSPTAESDYSEELECGTITQTSKGSGSVASTVSGWDNPVTSSIFVIEKRRSRNVVVIATPSENFVVTALKVDGVWQLSPVSSHGFNDITESHVVYFVFQKQKTLTNFEWIK